MKAKSRVLPERTEIRPVRPSDADALRELYAFSLRCNTAGFIQDPLYHGDIAERAHACQADGGSMLGVFLEGQLVGFGGLKRKDAGRAELVNLHLHPDYQGMGVGKELALSLLEDAKKLGYSIVELHVTVTQVAAVGLYRQLGFVQTGRKTYDVESQSFDTIFMEIEI